MLLQRSTLAPPAINMVAVVPAVEGCEVTRHLHAALVGDGLRTHGLPGRVEVRELEALANGREVLAIDDLARAGLWRA